MKKIITVVGARPNFMKVAPIERALKKEDKTIEHFLVHTGQHYDVKMSDAFFVDLGLPKPKYFLGIGSGSHAVQTAKIMIEFEKILLEEKPDLIIVVGDVNSTVACTLTAVKLGIEVAHIESGLRSFDRKMPEEINRIITDSICDYCFVTEESGRLNLIIENTPEEKIFFVGNTMIDSSFYALPKADKSDIMEQLKVEKNNFALATIHRPSNVDDKIQFTEMLTALAEISEKIKVIFPIHPRSRKNLENFGLSEILKNSNIILTDPLGYIEFLALMKNATMVLTDSGGIQEETTALKIPCITLRTTTERPVTCEIGTNILIMPEKEIIIKTANDVLNGKVRKGQIPDLWDGNAAERIVEVIKNTIFK